MIENWIDGEHYSRGFSGQTISISFEIFRLQGDVDLNAHVDALPSSLLDPLEGLSMLNCGKLELEGRSRLSALKGVRGAC